MSIEQEKMIKNRFLNIYLCCQSLFMQGSSEKVIFCQGQAWVSSFQQGCSQVLLAGSPSFQEHTLGWQDGILAAEIVLQRKISLIFRPSLHVWKCWGTTSWLNPLWCCSSWGWRAWGWLWAWYHIFTYHSCLIWRCQPVQGHHPWTEQIPMLLDALRRLSPAFCQLFL